MAGDKLQFVLKNQGKLFKEFLKKKSQTQILDFVLKPVDHTKAYHEYFSETPNVDLKLTARVLSPARKIYAMKFKAYTDQEKTLQTEKLRALEVGDMTRMKEIDAEIKAIGDPDSFASGGANFKVIVKAAREDRIAHLNTLAGEEFREFVIGKVDGKKLAAELDLPVAAAVPLAEAKALAALGDIPMATKAANASAKIVEKSAKGKPLPDWMNAGFKKKKGGETIMGQLKRTKSGGL